MAKDKIKDFLEEYKKLVDKYGVDFASYPMFVPNNDGSFKVIIQSTPVDMEEQAKQKRESFMAKNV